MRLDAKNKRWPDGNTAKMAGLFEDAGFDRAAEAIIRDGKKKGLTDREIRDAIGRKMGYDLAEAHDMMRQAGWPLGHALLIDPWDCKFDWRTIADTYLESYRGSRRKGGPSPRNGAAGKASNNSRPKVKAKMPAKAKTTTRRCRT